VRYLTDCIQRLAPPVGVFAAHDNLGCMVIEVCHEIGLRVPYDLAVIGVNNYELLCETTQPPLSSICQPAEQIGYEAIRLLDRIVSGVAPTTPHVRLTPGRLIARQSTDFLAIDDADVVAALNVIHSNPIGQVTVQRVLGDVAVSRRTMDKKFVAALGRPLAEELRLAKIRFAQELLVNTNDSILDVSVRAGFSSLSGFSRAFRQITSMTPRGYRRAYGARVGG
jgi:LacI family transcriptional regulator